MACKKGRILPVPLIESAKELRSINDLDTNIWVASQTLGGGVSDVTVGQKALALRYMAYFIPNYRDSMDPKNRVLYKAGVSWKGNVLYLDINTDKPYYVMLLGCLQYGMCMTSNFLFPTLCNENWLRLGPPSDTLSGQLLFDAQVNVLQGLYEKDQDEVHGPSAWDDDSNALTVGREYVKTEEILHVAEPYPVRLEVLLSTHVSHGMKEKFKLFALHMRTVKMVDYYRTWELLDTQGAIDDHLAISTNKLESGDSMLSAVDVMITEPVVIKAFTDTLKAYYFGKSSRPTDLQSLSGDESTGEKHT
ncbi:hypothetical protein ARMGADRAFT_1028337 [Armillaria gallica]|uniref:Uncharacterized protein n=1 Tax=Armillaria gallica TaxID=47427 RepID=A0A2H3DXH4_ARMGA|nr:hypothetical protein ARMGADRAFT_1028337 [Armillaria gallica]